MYGESKTRIQFTMLKKLEDLEFADDMVLLSQKIAHAVKNMRHFKIKLLKLG